VDEHFQQESVRLFPTTHKKRIGAYLSWSVGTERLSQAFLAIPQAGQVEVCFHEHWPSYHQGKWPSKFSVLEVQYCRYRNVHQTGKWAEPNWEITVRPVPREQKHQIREALETHGFATVSRWLEQNARISGREGRVTLVVTWDSSTGDLSYAVQGVAVPEVTTDAATRQHPTNKRTE
jgi:hypothetical protein